MTSFDGILTLPDGAHFLSADLHIHSFGGSRDVSDSTMTPENIVSAAIERGLSLIAITDHNTARNVSAAIEAAKKCEPSLLVVPGAEVTTANGHLLVYFSEVETVDKLLARIDVRDRSEQSDGHTPMSMAQVVKEVDALGGFAIAAHIDRPKSGFEEFVSGYQGAKRDVLVQQALRGLEFDEPARLAWYSTDDSGPNSAERKKLLLARRDAGSHVHLAHVQNSDAHSLKQFLQSPVGTRIKLDELSFPAFETAFKDPTARVRATALLPHSYPRILGMHVKGGFLDGELLHFSANLNCFLGGRGTGKSTALRAIAHALGFDERFAEDRTDCPEYITVFVEDEHGIQWSYHKPVNEDLTASATNDPTNILDNASFPIEYYPQNALSRVSDDLTRDGTLLQGFLDSHLHASDLFERETSLRKSADDIAIQLEPLELAIDNTKALTSKLRAVDTLLKSAEQGKLKEVVASQAQLANERHIVATLERRLDAVLQALKDLDLSVDFQSIVEANSPTLSVAKSKEWRQQMSAMAADYTASAASAKESLITLVLQAREQAERIKRPACDFHDRLQQKINERLAHFETQGLRPTTQGLRTQVANRERIAAQLARIKESLPTLQRLRAARSAALEDLRSIRSEIEGLRKKQLAPINASLAQTIDQFRVIFRYENAGHIGDYYAILSDIMAGSYIHDPEKEAICRSIAPQDLARICRDNNLAELGAALSDAGVQGRWASELIKRCTRKWIYRLETCWRPPSVALRVLTRTEPPKDIPVAHLSDGQRHTILLTVAMLGNSLLPLLIDQPEDDLDNFFISRTVVDVLRRVKERRQVIVVTHNANIAVLGDAEHLFPMERRGENGRTHSTGSIDRTETRTAVEKVLEGGRDAFKRRAELYNLH